MASRVGEDGRALLELSRIHEFPQPQLEGQDCPERPGVIGAALEVLVNQGAKPLWIEPAPIEGTVGEQHTLEQGPRSVAEFEAVIGEAVEPLGGGDARELEDT